LASIDIGMKNYWLILFVAALTLSLWSCQSDNDRAIKNFEVYFEDFHAASPADQGTYEFEDYSELEELREGEEVVGYSQSANAVRTGLDGEITTTQIFIFYDTELQVEGF